MTELWFFQSIINAGSWEHDRDGAEVRTPKFGYMQCQVVIDDQQYLIKYKNMISPSPRGQLAATYENLVFYVKKHKHRIGKQHE